MQHAVKMARTCDTNMVGQMEAALEGTCGDATMQVSARRVFIGFLGGYNQCAVFNLDRQIFVRETGDGNRNTIGVVSGFFDIVRG